MTSRSDREQSVSNGRRKDTFGQRYSLARLVSAEFRAYIHAIFKEWRAAVTGSAILSALLGWWERANPANLLSALHFGAILGAFLIVASYRAWKKEYVSNRPTAQLAMIDERIVGQMVTSLFLCKLKNVGIGPARNVEVRLAILDASLTGEVIRLIDPFLPANEIAQMQECPVRIEIYPSIGSASFAVHVSYEDLGSRRTTLNVFKKCNGLGGELTDATRAEKDVIVSKVPDFFT